MKILFVSDNFPPETNAAASRVFERAKHWVKAGHEVTFLTSAPNFPQGKVYKGYKNRWYQREEMEGIKVIRVKTFMVPNKGFFLRILDFLSFMFMAIIIGSFLSKRDIILATSPQFFAGYAGLILAKIKRIPFVLELSDLWPESIKGTALLTDSYLYQCLEKLELYLYRHSCHIIVQTYAFANNLIKRGVPPHKITTVLNGVDTEFFQPQKQKNESLVRQYNLENKKVIGYIGTLGMAHNLIHALNIAKQLEKEDIVFIFVGTGAEKPLLERYKNQHNLSNVIFIPPQKKTDIVAWWSICDAALVHLKNDSAFASVIPSKIFEAMAVAKPIILISPIGEASRIVVDNQIGIHLSTYDVIQDKESILSFLNSQPLFSKFISNMHQNVKSYDRSLQARKFLKALTEVLQKE